VVARREEGRKKEVSRWRGAAAVPDEAAADEAAEAVEKGAAEEDAAKDAAAAVAIAAAAAGAAAGATGVGKAATAGSARSVGTGVESRGVESRGVESRGVESIGSGVGIGMHGNDIGGVGTYGFAGSAVGARPRSGCTDQTRTTPSSLPLTSQSPVQERRAQSRQQISSVPAPIGSKTSKEASSRSAALPFALCHPPASVPASAPDDSPGRTALERSTSGGWLGVATSHR
jgi:hypothetical protein